MEDRLTNPRVQKALSTSWLGRSYRYLPVVDSTNDLLNDQTVIADPLTYPSGTVLLTEYQARGRGRMGRSWEAPAGSSLLFSILLRPDWPAERLHWLTMISGLAVSEAVEDQTGMAVRLKWPNDGVIERLNAWYKYCGILLEGSISGNALLEYAVAGIGVNVNIPGEQLPAANFPTTSLLVAGGHPVSRLDLLSVILTRFEHHYELVQNGGSPHEAWQKRLIFLNERVAVSLPGQETPITGIAVGTDREGRLLVRNQDGEVYRISAGDITLRKYLD